MEQDGYSHFSYFEAREKAARLRAETLKRGTRLFLGRIRDLFRRRNPIAVSTKAGQQIRVRSGACS